MPLHSTDDVVAHGQTEPGRFCEVIQQGKQLAFLVPDGLDNNEAVKNHIASNIQAMQAGTVCTAMGGEPVINVDCRDEHSFDQLYAKLSQEHEAERLMAAAMRQ